jgi:hypothetical protein
MLWSVNLVRYKIITGLFSPLHRNYLPVFLIQSCYNVFNIVAGAENHANFGCAASLVADRLVPQIRGGIGPEMCQLLCRNVFISSGTPKINHRVLWPSG